MRRVQQTNQRASSTRRLSKSRSAAFLLDDSWTNSACIAPQEVTSVAPEGYSRAPCIVSVIFGNDSSPPAHASARAEPFETFARWSSCTLDVQEGGLRWQGRVNDETGLSE